LPDKVQGKAVTHVRYASGLVSSVIDAGPCRIWLDLTEEEMHWALEVLQSLKHGPPDDDVFMRTVHLRGRGRPQCTTFDWHWNAAAPPPLLIQRGNGDMMGFSVEVPHEVGMELLQAVKERLDEPQGSAT